MPRKEVYRKNPEKYRAESRKWSKNNPEKRRASWQKSGIKHRAKRNRQKRQYYKKKYAEGKRPSTGIKARMEAYAKKTGNPMALYKRHKNPAKKLGAVCECCQSTDTLHRDHIIPISCGGGHYPTQTQALCRSCNFSKHDGTHCRIHKTRLAPDWWIENNTTTKPKFNTYAGTL